MYADNLQAGGDQRFKFVPSASCPTQQPKCLNGDKVTEDTDAFPRVTGKMTNSMFKVTNLLIKIYKRLNTV